MRVRASMRVAHFNASRWPGIAVWWTIRQGFSGVKSYSWSAPSLA